MSYVEKNGPVKHAVINKNAATSNEIVAAVSGKAIRVLSLNLTAAGAVDVTIEDEDSTKHIGLIPMAANASIVLNHNPCGHCELASGKALHMLLGAGVQVGGSVTYQEVLPG